MAAPYLPTRESKDSVFLNSNNSITDQVYGSIYDFSSRANNTPFSSSYFQQNVLGNQSQSYLPTSGQNVGQMPSINVSDYSGNGYNFDQGYSSMQNGMSPMIEGSLMKMYDANANLLNAQMNRVMNPTFAETYIQPAAQAVGALSSLGNMYLGFQNLSLQKKQLGIAREQWAMTKDEMARISANRKALSEKYFA